MSNPFFIKVTMITGQQQVDDLEVVTETTTPAYVNTSSIREFYARREGKPGTRISLLNGSGLAVHETVDELYTMITGTRA